jgi:hypothetical protein
MDVVRTPSKHTGKLVHAGHAPPKFHSLSNTQSTLSYIRRPLPPPPRNKDSVHGIPDSQANNETTRLVSARLCNFDHHIPLKHDVKYTYAVNPSHNIVYFFEYRGYGIPLPTLGALGDVYIDLTDDSHALYTKNATGWARWTLPGWLEHPFLTDTVLSLSPEGVIWTHPMMADKFSQDADIHRGIHDMLSLEADSPRSNEAPLSLPVQPESVSVIPVTGLTPQKEHAQSRPSSISSRRPRQYDKDNESDATAAGDSPRKRPRVDEETSPTAVSEFLFILSVDLGIIAPDY